MDQNEIQRLVQKYQNLSTEELNKIILDKEGHTEEAISAAKEVLGSDRQDYYKNLADAEDRISEQNKRQEIITEHPLYEIVSKMAEDIHFMKTVIVAILTLAFIEGLILIFVSFF